LYTKPGSGKLLNNVLFKEAINSDKEKKLITIDYFFIDTLFKKAM
jgi:hypothetical protein